MTETVRTRLARDTDVAQLARLRWDSTAEEVELAGGQFSEFHVGFRDWFRAEGGRFVIWVAETGSRLIGSAWVELVEKVPRPTRPRARWGYVTAVYVEPAYRDQGVGTALLEAARDWARDEELELLVVWPAERSVSLYERVGFGVPPELLELPLTDGDR